MQLNNLYDCISEAGIKLTSDQFDRDWDFIQHHLRSESISGLKSFISDIDNPVSTKFFINVYDF